MILLIRLINLAAFLYALYLPYEMYTAQKSWETDIYQVKKNEVQTKYDELAAKTAQVKRAEEFESQKNSKSEALKALRLSVDQQAKLVPKKANLREVLRALADRADSTGLEFSTFKPEVERRVKFLVLSPVSVVLKGTYTQVMSFLDAAANMERAVTTESLVLATPASTRGGVSSVTATAQLIAYHLDESAMADSVAAAATAPPAAKGTAAPDPNKKGP